MERCDVLIVGGGPAGSTCAASLVRAGLDVLIADKATFPRDKICAGWITPAVVDELALDLEDYARDRTLDRIVGFRVGRMGDRLHDIRYDVPMSYGIRRCELDHYLLVASGARVVEGRRLDKFERASVLVGDHARSGWIAGGEIEATVLVGAGGHFCPVARALGGGAQAGSPVITAEEVEFAIEGDDAERCAVQPGIPELYYTRDLTGYGWAFRKGDYLNIGLGVRTAGSTAAGGNRLSHRIEEFLAFLQNGKRIDVLPKKKMSGHAYLLRQDSRRTACGDGFVLIGDAAGLAYDRSGEGIRPAVESGMLAARSILRFFDGGSSDSRNFTDYGAALDNRFGKRGFDPASMIPQPLLRGVAATLMASEWFSRRVLLERWFLHTDQQALAA